MTSRERMRGLLLLLALIPLAAPAQSFPRYGDPAQDAGEQSAEERNLQLPPFPREEDLVRVSLNVPGSFDYFVDAQSVGVGADGVVRFVLVARSSGGATNVEFEGIRCKDRSRKLYALGRADRTWVAPRNPRWTPISDLPVNMFEAVLHDTYFCPFRIIVGDVDEARKALRSGGNPRAELPR